MHHGAVHELLKVWGWWGWFLVCLLSGMSGPSGVKQGLLSFNSKRPTSSKVHMSKGACEQAIWRSVSSMSNLVEKSVSRVKIEPKINGLSNDTMLVNYEGN